MKPLEIIPVLVVLILLIILSGLIGYSIRSSSDKELKQFEIDSLNQQLANKEFELVSFYNTVPAPYANSSTGFQKYLIDLKGKNENLVYSVDTLKNKVQDLNFRYELAREYFLKCYWATQFQYDYVGTVKYFDGKDLKDYYLNACIYSGSENWNKIIGEVRVYE